jgi:hypothetical protein
LWESGKPHHRFPLFHQPALDKTRQSLSGVWPKFRPNGVEGSAVASRTSCKKSTARETGNGVTNGFVTRARLQPGRQDEHNHAGFSPGAPPRSPANAPLKPVAQIPLGKVTASTVPQRGASMAGFIEHCINNVLTIAP